MRLIDADALIEQMEADADHMDDCLAQAMLYASINDVKNAPTVTERKKGEWIYHTEPLAFRPYGHYTCSLCNEIAWDESNFCSNCGADMRRQENDS